MINLTSFRPLCIGKVKLGTAAHVVDVVERPFGLHCHVYKPQQSHKSYYPTSTISAWEGEPTFLRRNATELIQHVSQVLLGGATIVGGIFAGTWFYMSTKQARKASREPGEKGALPSC